MTAAQYVCEHDREGTEMLDLADDMLPPHIVWRECPICGAAAEWDINEDEAAH
jgi:hypothetical protein